MALEAVSREIDGYNYKVYPFAGEEKLKIWIRLVKLLGPSVGLWSEGSPGGAVGKLCELLDEKDFAALALRMLKKTEREGLLFTEAIFSVAFAEQGLATLFKVLGLVVEVNYGDFWVGDNSIGKRVQGLAAQMLAMTTRKEPNVVAESSKDLTPN